VKKLPLYLTVGVLVAVGLALILYKVMVLGFPLQPESESSIWTVQARFTVDGHTRPVKAILQILSSTPGFTVLDENFVSRGFGLTIVEEDGGREAQWAIRRAAGRQTFYYQAVVTPELSTAGGPGPPTDVGHHRLEEPHATAAEAVVAQVRAQSADVSTFTSELLRHLNDPEPDENTALFLSSGRSLGQRVEIAVSLLAAGEIPARAAYGLVLEEGERHAQFNPVLEVWDGDSWLWFDPATGEEGLPEDVLIWWDGDKPLIDVVGGSNPEVEISTWRNTVDALQLAERRADAENSRILDFSLLRLPIQIQAVYQILLLVPIGAFIMVLLRNVIGVKTFGTFMPVLVALAFRETRLVAGLILFVLVVALGVGLRFLLDRLRLLLVPRLAAVLVLVVLSLLAVSILSHQLELERGLSVALFPLVILTIAIERMSIVWEEVGPAEAIKQGLGTLVVAALAYLVMSLDQVEYMVFVFPEILLLILAAILLLGRYSGYRLLELVRFRALGGEGA
jgi:hypothetical protein